jgi:predicted nucleic-acid-binding Zn-ribbon protein
MQQTPVLDWTCSRCGASETYQLVPAAPGEPRAEPATNWKRKLATLDWTCSHCGSSETYELVPMSARSDS